MSNQNRRQELYDRIRQSSKQEVIVEEMIRLGFWPESRGQPSDPAAEIRRRGELQREIQALSVESARLRDIAALKREARKRRLAESRRKRADNKERRLRERAERKARWAERKKREITYLGEGVSAGLDSTASDVARLERAGLPVLSTAAELASAMNIAVGELRFLAYHRAASRVSHYARFALPKRTGGERVISAPKPRLKRAQRWVLRNVLDASGIPGIHDAAHGFRAGRSIVSNAAPHAGARVVVNLDLEDFFPTVEFPRVKGVFRSLGYSDAVATILGLLCTEPETAHVVLDDETFYVAVGNRVLPQGAPTSPGITNLLCRRLDRRLQGAASKLGFAYTRYADDLTFSASGSSGDAAPVGRLLRQVEWIVSQEGFSVHPDKTRVLRRGRRQEVTGLVVNDVPAVPRDVLRRFRATLYQIEKDGPEGKTWGNGGDVIASVLGFANYVAMVQPDKGADLRRRALALASRHGGPGGGPSGRREPREDAGEARSDAADGDAEPGTSGESDKKKWWKLF